MCVVRLGKSIEFVTTNFCFFLPVVDVLSSSHDYTVDLVSDMSISMTVCDVNCEFLALLAI